MEHSTLTPDKDPQLWEVAKRRAAFKRHLAVYLAINAFLWAIWLIGGARTYGNSIPWPVWSTLGWGIGLFFNYLGAYQGDGTSATQREYEKLTKQ